jgi:hypothetical protein
MKLYRHYKQKFYKYLGEVRHSENEEALVIYDCLYPNPSGQTWVRPKAMFHEVIEHEGRKIPRFEPVELKILESEGLEPGQEAELIPLITEAFGDWDPEWFHSTLKSQPIQHLTRAYVDGRLAGFKLGFAKDRWTFHSWLGAVAKDLQVLGICQGLMQAQHAWCRSQGYRVIQTTTLNQFRQMLILNLKNGFEIHGTRTSSRGLKIILEKKL